jgi:hypothetical protein
MWVKGVQEQLPDYSSRCGKAAHVGEESLLPHIMSTLHQNDK